MSTSRADRIDADHGSEVQIGDRHTHYHGDSQHIVWQAESLEKALFNAVRGNDLSRALQIVGKGPTLNADTCRDLGGMSALHWAVEHDNLEMAKLLIERCDAWADIPKTTVHLDPDDKDVAAYRQFLAERQHTPLFSAILHQRAHGHGPQMVHYLLDQGCSLTKVAFCFVNEMKHWRGNECRDIIDAIIWYADGKTMESPSTLAQIHGSAQVEDPFGELIARVLSAKRPRRLEVLSTKAKGIDWLCRQNQVTIRGDIRSLNIMEAWMDRYLTLGASKSKSHAALQLLRLVCSTLPSSEPVPALRPAINYYFDRIGFAGSWIGYPVGSDQDRDLAVSLLFVIVALRQSGADPVEARHDFDQLRVRELWAVANCQRHDCPVILRKGSDSKLGVARRGKTSKDSDESVDLEASTHVKRRDRILNVLKGLFTELGYFLEDI